MRAQLNGLSPEYWMYSSNAIFYLSTFYYVITLFYTYMCFTLHATKVHETLFDVLLSWRYCWDKRTLGIHGMVCFNYRAAKASIANPTTGPDKRLLSVHSLLKGTFVIFVPFCKILLLHMFFCTYVHFEHLWTFFMLCNTVPNTGERENGSHRETDINGLSSLMPWIIDGLHICNFRYSFL